MKNIEANEIEINSESYIKKSSVPSHTPTLNGLEYKMVRTYRAGVFVGYLESQVGQEVVLLNARRIWYWSGAASLSELAERGTSDPNNCKFPCEVKRVKLLQAIEILDVSERAKKSIESVKIWTE